MTPIQVTGIEIDQFMFDVEITHLVDQDPDPTCRDSADDFSGDAWYVSGLWNVTGETWGYKNGVITTARPDEPADHLETLRML